jgi:hypothetical protein
LLAQDQQAATRGCNSHAVKERMGPPAGRLPDPDRCVIELHPALEDYAHCRTPQPHECPYALPVGRGFFCRHPERQQFLIPLAQRGKKRT